MSAPGGPKPTSNPGLANPAGGQTPPGAPAPSQRPAGAGGVDTPGGRLWSRGWKPWAIGFLILAAVIFIAQNSQSVEVDFIFASTETPLIFALLLAFGLGVAIGWLVPRLRRRD